MRVVCESGDERHTLATNVDIADGFVAQTVGLMGRSNLPEDYALVFDFGKPPLLNRLLGTVPRRFIHMLFVRVSLDVLWLRDDEVVKTATLTPWTGTGVARADRVIELPAGAAEDVSVGDTIHVTDTEE